MSAPSMSTLPFAWPAAVRDLDRTRHAIIEASAGTGKTYTLEHLVLALVLDGAPIEEILVVTFTDKATREMRARLRRRLEETARALSSGATDVHARTSLERVRTALVAFDRAPISTIHAFEGLSACTATRPCAHLAPLRGLGIGALPLWQRACAGA